MATAMLASTECSIAVLALVFFLGRRRRGRFLRGGIRRNAVFGGHGERRGKMLQTKGHNSSDHAQAFRSVEMR